MSATDSQRAFTPEQLRAEVELQRGRNPLASVSLTVQSYTALCELAAQSATGVQQIITEAMVEAAAQRMVALVVSGLIERPQVVQWQGWAGCARSILEAALTEGEPE